MSCLCYGRVGRLLQHDSCGCSRQDFWQKRHEMRQNEPLRFWKEHQGNGTPRGNWLPVRATKAGAGVNAVLHKDASMAF